MGLRVKLAKERPALGSLAIVLSDVAQPVSVQRESVRVDVKATLQSEALSRIHNIAREIVWD